MAADRIQTHGCVSSPAEGTARGWGGGRLGFPNRFTWEAPGHRGAVNVLRRKVLDVLGPQSDECQQGILLEARTRPTACQGAFPPRKEVAILALIPVWSCDLSGVAPGPVSRTFHTTSHPPPLASRPHPTPVPGPRASLPQLCSPVQACAEHAGSLVKTQIAGLPRKASEAGRPGQGPRICIPHTLPDIAVPRRPGEGAPL